MIFDLKLPLGVRIIRKAESGPVTIAIYIPPAAETRVWESQRIRLLKTAQALEETAEAIRQRLTAENFDAPDGAVSDPGNAKPTEKRRRA